MARKELNKTHKQKRTEMFQKLQTWRKNFAFFVPKGCFGFARHRGKMYSLKETELRKADRTVGVNCYYIFQPLFFPTEDREGFLPDS